MVRQCYSLPHIASDEENVQCAEGGRDFYSDLIFLINIICTQHMFKSLSILHTKTMRESWNKNGHDIVLKVISWFGFVPFGWLFGGNVCSCLFVSSFVLYVF